MTLSTRRVREGISDSTAMILLTAKLENKAAILRGASET